MFAHKKLNLLLRSIIFAIPLLAYNSSHAEDYDYQFASNPFEYATISNSNVKPNLVFLLDNSSFTLPASSQAIVLSIINDPEIQQNARAGLAYLYANTHPFFTMEIPTRFILCIARQLPAHIGALSGEISAAVAATGLTLGAAAVAAIPTILAAISAHLTTMMTTCAPQLERTDLNITLNSQYSTNEVPVDELTRNAIRINTSLAASVASPPLGLPIITRRYYEVTRELRKLDSNDNDNDNDNNTTSTNPPETQNNNANAIKQLLENIKNITNLISNIPLVKDIPVINQLSVLADLITSMSTFVGGTPPYEPLFNEAIEYRCQPNFVIVVSSGIVTPATINTTLLTNIIDLLTKAFTNAGIKSFEAYLPKFDFKPLTVPNDDSLVRQYTYKDNATTLNFPQWNNPVSQYGPHGLAFLSHLFDEKDILDSSKGEDAEGKSWDAEDYPLQNISTISIQATIRTNSGILNRIVSLPSNLNPSKDYLENGATYLVRIGQKGFYAANNATDLKKVIKDTIMGDKIKAVSNASSNVLAKMVPNQSVSAYINTSNWSSELRFYDLTKKETDYVADLSKFKTVSYGTLTDNLNGQDATRRVIYTKAKAYPAFLNQDESDFNKWLIRPSNMSDGEINKNFRNRCENESDNQCNARMLGDIISSPILAIDDNLTVRNRNEDPYATFIVTAANDGMLHIFKKTNSSENPYELKLDYLAGAAVRGDSKEKLPSDKEPTTLWEQLPNLSNPAYGKTKTRPHQYFNNGGIAYLGTMKKDCAASQEQFTCQSNPAQLFMVASYGQGARGLYALNLGGKDYISNEPIALSQDNQTQWLQDVPLWESGSYRYGASRGDMDITNKAHQRLGYIIGAPVIANVATNRTQNNELNQMKPSNGGDIHYAVFTHNGLFSDDKSPTLYVFDALGITKKESISAAGVKSAEVTKSNNNGGGELIAAIPTTTLSGNSARQGLSAPAVIDTDNDGIADIAYAGDYDGNLYRFDFRKPNPTDWSATMIYKAEGLENGLPKQPIIVAPTVYKNDPTGAKYIVTFGTGSDLFVDDLKQDLSRLNTKPQAIYGIFDNINEESTTPATKQDLLLQQMTATAGQYKNENKTVLQLSDNSINKNHRGWYVNLSNAAGERVVTSGKLTGNTVFFTTRIYQTSNGNTIGNANVCTNPLPNNHGYLIALNVKTGGALKRNIMNLNPISDRYKPGANFISGFKFDGSPSELSFVTLGQDGITNRSGQFNSGWEDAGITTVKQYDEGSLVVTSTKDEYYIITVKEPDYIKIRKINSRELF